jgi:hypothetical protein
MPYDGSSTTILGHLVSGAETNYGRLTGRQPASMVNPLYGQYRGFTNQYGFGEAGIQNYAQQIVAANPNATIGDFYGGYFGGTGNPARASTSLFGNWAQGPAAQRNWNRVLAQNGYSPSDPLSNFVGQPIGSQIGTGPPDGSAGLPAGPTPAITDGSAGGPGFTQEMPGQASPDVQDGSAGGPGFTQGGQGGASGLPPSYTPGGPDVQTPGGTFSPGWASTGDLPGGGATTTAPGGQSPQGGQPQSGQQGQGIPIQLGFQPPLQQATQSWVDEAVSRTGKAFTNALSNVFGDWTSYFKRGFLLLFGLLLVIAALALMGLKTVEKAKG